MNFMIIVSAIALTIILNCACRQKEIKSDLHIPDSTTNISHQKCLTDTSQSYYLALPPDFNPLKKYPLIIAFDPQGNGNLAVRSLVGAATNFGYMVTGSNVIRNGYENIENAFTTLTNDILNRYPVDIDRIYAAGFSGGGRFAQILSQMNTNIKSVISIGAGFSFNQSRPLRNKVPMLFLVGDEDFNYLEINNSKETLKLLGVQYFIFEFQGKHAWPERQITDEALLWFEFDDCRRNKTRKNDPVIKSYQEEIYENATRFMTDHDMMGACKEYEKGIAFLSGLTNTRTMIKKMKFCQESPDYKDKFDKMKSALSLESRLQQGYISALNIRDTLWWRNEIRKLNQQITEEDDPYLLSAFKRVKSFLSMAAYSFCNVSLKDNDLSRARKLIDIYQIVDPGNPDGYYFSALYYSMSGQSRMASELFRKAVDSGFKDFQKALNELPEEIYHSLPKSITQL
jgi:predicted esterase